MHDIGTEELELLKAVLESKQLMRYRGGEGGFTENFEKDICSRFGVNHALVMNSGTNALYCALAAMGIGPGDEVIVPAYTWIATAMAPLLVGAVPVIAEIDETMAIDPKDVEQKITPYTKAIIPVHMANRACDMDAIMAIAKRHNLKVLEDTCQAMGVCYKGRRLGTIGDTGAFSFNMFKNVTCGEGGMAVTNDERLYERILMMHDAGCYTRKNASSMKETFFPGFNFRVSEFQGAILAAQLLKMDSFINGLAERRDLACSILAQSKQFRLGPVNDKESLAISILFEDADTTLQFAKDHGLSVCSYSDRHIYSNWEPVLNKAYYDERLNPHKFAHRKIEYTPDMCPVTNDILSRSCYVEFPYNQPLKDVEAICRKMI